MELFFLCTALSLHVLDHCMKLYWKRKTQRTAGPTDRPTAQPTDQPTDHRVTPIYPPKLRFGGINMLTYTYIIATEVPSRILLKGNPIRSFNILYVYTSTDMEKIFGIFHN